MTLEQFAYAKLQANGDESKEQALIAEMAEQENEMLEAMAKKACVDCFHVPGCDARDPSTCDGFKKGGGVMTSGWLIEKQVLPPQYWNGRPKKDGLKSWTIDSLEAVRFLRKYDAEICVIAQGYKLASFIKAAEHQWI